MAVACEAESVECVDYVIGEIMAARRRTLRSCSGGGGGDSSATSDTGSIDFREAIQLNREFLEQPISMFVMCR